MSLQKTIALIILLLSTALGIWILKDVAFPGMLGILGLIGLQRKYTWDIKAQQRILSSLLVLLLLGLFSLHYHYAAPAPTAVPAVIAWQTVTRFFSSAMILVLFLGKPGVLPPSLGAFFLASVISAGQVLLLEEHEVVYRPLEFLSVILAALYACTDTEQRPAGLNPHHRRIKSRVWVFAIILLLALNTGWMFGSFLYRHHGTVNILSNLIWGENAIMSHSRVRSSSVGFTNSGKLSNLRLAKQNQDSGVQLRITSNHNPEYLRARGFDTYDFRTSQWLDRSLYLPVIGSNIQGFALGGPKRLFDLSSLNPDNFSDVQTMKIEHEAGFPNVMFCPLGALNLQWSGDHLMVSEYNGTFYNDNARSVAETYQIQHSPSALSPPPNVHLRQTLNIPRHLNPRIRELAQSLLGSCTTTKEKIDTVLQHFQDHYSYTLNMTLPPEEEPLTAFLLEGNAGYCEYFASGAAILLRLAGVPTRYITGFRIHRRDHRTQTWVAQASDAHAWIEVWDSAQQKWLTIEPTVTDESTTEIDTTPISTDGPHSQFNLREFIQGIYDYGLAGPLVQFFISGGIWGQLSFSLGIVLSLGLIVRYWIVTSRRLQGLGSKRHPQDDRLTDLHKQLKKLERRLQQFGQQRPAHESLSQFSQRLQPKDSSDPFWSQAATWVQRYNTIRYSSQFATDQIQDLKQDLETLLKNGPKETA